jgi:hypothetical protein
LTLYGKWLQTSMTTLGATLGPEKNLLEIWKGYTANPTIGQTFVEGVNKCKELIQPILHNILQLSKLVMQLLYILL